MAPVKLEQLIFEGYSKDKPILRYTAESVIELFTAPNQLETKTIRTYGIDSMLCTPLYDEVEAALNPPRAEMIEYVKAAIGEGYQPENEAAITDLSLIDALNDNDLNREFGKCWQWYSMGGGFHETFKEPKNKGFEEAAQPLIKWLAENVHSHHSVIVDSTHAELLEGQKVISTDEYLRD